MKPKTEAFKKATERGRVGIVAVNLMKGKVLTYVVLYGHTGGRKDQKQADATNLLLKLSYEELDAQPKGPKLIAGDLNADPSNLPFLQTMCQTDGWTDLGDKAHMWGGTSGEHTCLGHNAKQPTRNDYMIVNETCLPMVKGFRVLHQEGFLVHSVVQIKLDAAQVVTAYEEPKKPKSIYDLLQIVFLTMLPVQVL